jgi:hypothetical protein
VSEVVFVMNSLEVGLQKVLKHAGVPDIIPGLAIPNRHETYQCFDFRTEIGLGRRSAG